MHSAYRTARCFTISEMFGKCVQDAFFSCNLAPNTEICLSSIFTHKTENCLNLVNYTEI